MPNLVGEKVRMRSRIGEGAGDSIHVVIHHPDMPDGSEEIAMRNETTPSGGSSADRRSTTAAEMRTTLRSIRGEAVAILMAAMMVGALLLWMAAGHFRGMHGGKNDGGAPGPVSILDQEREPRQEGTVREGTSGRLSEEAAGSDDSVGSNHRAGPLGSLSTDDPDRQTGRTGDVQ